MIKKIMTLNAAFSCLFGVSIFFFFDSQLGKYNFFTFNNSDRGNWWGTMTCHIYNGGIPGYNQIINLGSQDVYLKSDMVQILEKNFMFSKEIYEI